MVSLDLLSSSQNNFRLLLLSSTVFIYLQNGFDSSCLCYCYGYLFSHAPGDGKRRYPGNEVVYPVEGSIAETSVKTPKMFKTASIYNFQIYPEKTLLGHWY